MTLLGSPNYVILIVMFNTRNCLININHTKHDYTKTKLQGFTLLKKLNHTTVVLYFKPDF